MSTSKRNLKKFDRVAKASVKDTEGEKGLFFWWLQPQLSLHTHTLTNQTIFFTRLTLICPLYVHIIYIGLISHVISKLYSLIILFWSLNNFLSCFRSEHYSLYYFDLSTVIIMLTVRYIEHEGEIDSSFKMVIMS